MSAVLALTLVVGFGAGGAAAGALARVLLGRMRRGTRVRAPACELAVAVAWAAVGAAWAVGAVPAGWLPALLGLGWLAVAAGAVDLSHHRLPDALTLPAVPVALAVLVPLGAPAVARGVVGAVAATVAHAVLHLAAPRAMGAGDVKLAGSVGAVLAAASWPALALGSVLAAVLTGVVAAAKGGLALARGRPPPVEVAHGPAMLAAAWLVVAAAAVGAGSGFDGG